MEKHENDEISAIGKVLRFAIAKFRLRAFEKCVSRPGMFSTADKKALYEEIRRELTRDSVESAEAVVAAFSKGQVPSNAGFFKEFVEFSRMADNQARFYQKKR